VQRLLGALTIVCAGAVVLAAQAPAAYWLKKPEQLKNVFPRATSFSDKEGNPPHFKAYVADETGKPVLAGYVFWTTELEPLERGYDGPIKMLVGMDLAGRLTSVLVVDHHEPAVIFRLILRSLPSSSATRAFATPSVSDLMWTRFHAPRLRSRARRG
jgi:transcriptional regulator of nitric oxide reductase